MLQCSIYKTHTLNGPLKRCTVTKNALRSRRYEIARRQTVDGALSVGRSGGELVIGKDCGVGSIMTVRVVVDVRPLVSVAT